MSVSAGHIKDLGIEKIVLFPFDIATDTLHTNTLTSGTNFMDYGILGDASFNKESSVQEFKDITLKVRDANKDFSTKITGTAMQTSKELHDWSYTTGDNYYIAYCYCGIKNAKYQELFSIVKDTGKFNVTNPGGTTSNKFEFTVINWDSAVQLTPAQLTTMRSAVTTYPIGTATITLPANQASVMSEVSV